MYLKSSISTNSSHLTNLHPTNPKSHYTIAAIPTNPITPAAAAAKGTLVAAANPLDVGAGAPPELVPAAPALLEIVVLPVVVVLITEVLPFLSTVANKLVVSVVPILVIVLSTVTFPVVVGLTVATLASLLITLRECSIALNRLWYCEGRAVMKGGGVVAVRAEETMEFMFPVMETAEAADSIATARLGRMEEGKYWAAKAAAAEAKAGAEVLWMENRISVCQAGRQNG